MLAILDGFSFCMIPDVPAFSKCTILQMTINFELMYFDISSRPQTLYRLIRSPVRELRH